MTFHTIQAKVSLFAAMVFFTTLSYAQSPFRFDKVEHQFGEIYESAGPVSAKFWFTNTGDKPLYISDVNVSCGCTTPDYKKDTLQPGEKSFINAKFDPSGRPGMFKKTISVTFNNNPGFLAFLTIEGNVIAVVQPNKKKYSILYGTLSFDNTTFQFSDIQKSGEHMAKIRVSNDGSNHVKFLSTQDLPKHFRTEFPKELKPGDTAELKVYVSKEDLENIWGEFSYRLVLITNDVLMNTKILYVKGKTVQDFSGISKAELAVAPIIKASATTVNFGELKQGGTKMQQITISNTGKSDLEIRNIHAGCYCFSGKTGAKVLKPGETAKVDLTFDSIGQRPGKMSRSLTIYTNDPKQPELQITGSIEIK
jgi:hypothetical protein